MKQVIEADIASGAYKGAAIIVSRHGRIGLSEALGSYSSTDDRRIAADSVFSLFSLTKAFTNVLILRSVELGRFALTTRVSDIIPEFAGAPRNAIRIDHLLTHQTGLPSVFTPRPDLPIDRLDVVVEAICRNLHGMEEPGGKVSYAPMAAHALMGEILVRTDPGKRSFRDIVEQDLLGPLNMTSTSVGVRADLKPRHIVPEIPADFPATHPSSRVPGPHGAFEDEIAEMPWVGMVSSAGDLLRFAEMLRRGGELDGARILSPRTIEMATTNRTGEAPNEVFKAMALARGWAPYPAYIGLGFLLRGQAICHTQFGTLATPRTFGNHGAGSTLFWVDPELDMSFVCLTTKLLPEYTNIERFQRLSDIAISAACEPGSS
ncbi:MAG: beta-lactamase family protein [Novosphingobium sp.]|nr:beta-lactamase family protein [Novosphingobium sp.]MBO9601586.1 beta-lactamase family protein [Novosphingobium sp.]